MGLQARSKRNSIPFDMIGNLPEDLVAEVLSYLPDMSDMRRLIHWQTVSKTWRRILHSPMTKVYHQLLLHNVHLRALLPPPHYYGGNHSFYSYATFRRALRTDLAIRKGNFRSATPWMYSACGGYVKEERYGAVDGGPFFSDGFLVWLERSSNLMTGGKTVFVRYLDFSNVTRTSAKQEPIAGSITVAQFERPGESEAQLETLFRNTSNHWVALGYGSGIVAFWSFMDKYITVRGVHESNKLRWKLPLSALLPPPDGGNLYVREIFCSKDYLVISISRSATLQVFSMSSRKRIHLINLRGVYHNKETTDFYYDTVASGNAEYAAGIGDNRYFMYANTEPTAFYHNIIPGYREPPPEFYFYCWDLKPQSPDTESRCSWDDQPESLEAEELLSNIQEPQFNIPIDPLASNQSISSADAPKPPKYNPPLTFLRPISRHPISLSWKAPVRFTSPKIKLNTSTRELLFYCPQHCHPPHIYYRFSYPDPPETLRIEEKPWCDHCVRNPYRHTARGYTPALREDDRQFAHLELKYNTELVFSDQSRRYRLALSPISVLRGGKSLRGAITGRKEHRCRLQMLRPNPPPPALEDRRRASVGGGIPGEVKAHWDMSMGKKEPWRSAQGYADRVWVGGGWEGVAVLFNGKFAVWRWGDYEAEEEEVFKEVAVTRRLLKRQSRRQSWLPGKA
ncbi:unnamed protein product [Tuber melanosporum]|uniref:(Perigord truffle) hypothetical protein n=1 Tax=Tuber melanosporum (strain Mel28) TaxID=656061 RepID=D5GC41_TUBMM|nr:uncharacterized protein GSTUM_00000553001 [Tuber melanosporum]CAZ82084.1 unnamed protein product [Tuber melanosporum]